MICYICIIKCQFLKSLPFHARWRFQEQRGPKPELHEAWRKISSAVFVNTFHVENRSAQFMSQGESYQVTTHKMVGVGCLAPLNCSWRICNPGLISCLSWSKAVPNVIIHSFGNQRNSVDHDKNCSLLCLGKNFKIGNNCTYRRIYYSLYFLNNVMRIFTCWFIFVSEYRFIYFDLTTT